MYRSLSHYKTVPFCKCRLSVQRSSLMFYLHYRSPIGWQQPHALHCPFTIRVSKSSVFDADQSVIFWLFFSQWRIYSADEMYWHGPPENQTANLEIRILASALAIWIRVISCKRTRACNKRDFELEHRVPACGKIVFSVDDTDPSLLCRDEQLGQRAIRR